MDSHRLFGVVPRAMQQALVYFIQESACVNFKFLLYLLSAFDSLRQRETEGNWLEFIREVCLRAFCSEHQEQHTPPRPPAVFKTPPWKTGERSAVSTTARAPGVARGGCRRMLLCPSLPSPRSGLLTVGWERSFLTCRAARTEPMSSSASLQRRSPLLDTLYKWPLGPLRGRFYSINILDFFFFLWDLQQFEKKTDKPHSPETLKQVRNVICMKPVDRLMVSSV